jgi:hypothetical protein
VGAVGVGAAMVGVDCDFGRHWAGVCSGVGGGGAIGVGGHLAVDVEGCPVRRCRVSWLDAVEVVRGLRFVISSIRCSMLSLNTQDGRGA